ncbi:MAG: heavy metal translocating P-type ATPase [Proteobacteria bacterium]|nr:heavy metal translocating P-type ATPase [Pseudomonadota bacterium]
MTLAIDTPHGGTAAPFVHTLADGNHAVTCAIQGIHCAACVQKIESALEANDSVIRARVNASTHRLHLSWNPAKSDLAPLLERVQNLGYRAAPCDAADAAAANKSHGKALLQALAIAGFGAMNVMVISVAVWAGLAEDMGPSTRGFLHWISALIAVPTVSVAGYPFFRSAWRAVATRSSNMDVPISLAVVITTLASVFETVRGAEHVYFDAALGLLFFLLIGRYLDSSLRGRALSASQNLLALRGKMARVIRADGRTEDIAVDAVALGDQVHVAPGQHFQVDGRIIEGTTTIDLSLITGEALPQMAGPGTQVYAGSSNLDAAVVVQATSIGSDTLLAEISALTENAEQHRGRYVSLADRLAQYYTPLVFGFSIAGFVLWSLVLGAGWHEALMIAVAVLIVTCPCALGLAVPAVHVGAVARLFRQGILVKSGDALERLSEVDTFVFDKTGTLTTGRMKLANPDGLTGAMMAVASGMAANSTHPLARALAGAFPTAPLAGTKEYPGEGLSYQTSGGEYRLGRAEFVVADSDHSMAGGPEMWFSSPNTGPVHLQFADTLRGDAGRCIRGLVEGGCQVEMLSGDRTPIVAAIANQVSIESWRAECRPGDKVGRLNALRDDRQKVAMVGDGLNDAPALAAAHVSLSPSTASDISQNAADIVFQGDLLAPVAEAHVVARKSMRLIRENICLAIGYNLVAVPVALSGALTPLIAALLMSASSIVVTLNALRIRSGRTTL